MNPLVSPAWVADRLEDPRVVLLDATLPPVGVLPVVDVYGRYLEAHLPGAVYFDIEALSDKATTLPHMLPRPEVFAEAMTALGVSDSMIAVVYEQGAVFSAPRAWWTLRTFGMREVFVLDGGLPAWRASGLPVERGPVTRPRASFAGQWHPEAVRSFAEVQQVLAAQGQGGAQILDARPAGRFAGTAPEPRPGVPSGHMPGAVNVPYTELLAEGQMLPPEEIRRVLEARGVDVQRPVVTTCGSGVTAAVLALGLEMCGAGDVGLYDGSWAEYAGRPEAVVVRE